MHHQASVRGGLAINRYSDSSVIGAPNGTLTKIRDTADSRLAWQREARPCQPESEHRSEDAVLVVTVADGPRYQEISPRPANKEKMI